MRFDCDCNAIGDTANVSPHVPSTSTQNAILSLLIINIIQSPQIYVAIDNPSLVPSISWFTTSSYPGNSVDAANTISHPENLQKDGCRCFSHIYKFRDRIQVTRVSRYCGEHQA